MEHAPPPNFAGRPLQLIRLNMQTSEVDPDPDALAFLTERLRKSGAKSVAVVSVMGAFRTGKSFLLDLMLRYLRYCETFGVEAESSPPPARGSGAEYPLPAWISSRGASIEGGGEEQDGFRFKGGMESCTEGIWVWSEPFLRKIDGELVALLLMDTQGAWDATMSKEQSATIFGLTAVLSSKLVYNIDKMISEDKVENLTYFMQFAQTAIQKASVDILETTLEPERKKRKTQLKEEVERPFQSLDFLARDWKFFSRDWTVEQCQEQMTEHKAKFLDPTRVREKETVEVLNQMFHRINCFCLPHPGFAIEEETWTGAVADISTDFIRFVDVYIKQVFNTDLRPKKILGNELSPHTFRLVLDEFVKAFHNAAPSAMSFVRAIRESSTLMAREQAIKNFGNQMERVLSQNPRGIETAKFDELHERCVKNAQDEYQRCTIFGGEDVRNQTWETIRESLENLSKHYKQENQVKLDKVLAGFAPITLLGVSFFALDKISDYACDWFSNTCVQVSKMLLICYVVIFCYIAWHVYLLVNERGRFAAATAVAELWTEIIKLLGVYSDFVRAINWRQMPELAMQACKRHCDAALREDSNQHLHQN